MSILTLYFVVEIIQVFYGGDGDVFDTLNIGLGRGQDEFGKTLTHGLLDSIFYKGYRTYLPGQPHLSYYNQILAGKKGSGKLELFVP